MKFLVLTLALTSFACTCGRAQIVKGEPLKFENASIAFIKNPDSGPIDSIAISTSIDKVAYGFSFTQDTLLMDVEVLLPIDELTIETFANGQPHGKGTCWVDPPSANVHLSVSEGKGSVDSVGLSEVDRWYQEKVQAILLLQNLNSRKSELSRAIYNSGDDLITVRFIEAYLKMPNLTAQEAYYLREAMKIRFEGILEHPDFQRLSPQINLLAVQRPALLKKLVFQDVKRRQKTLPNPTTDFFLLEIYDGNSPISQENHRALLQSKGIDSLLQEVPMVSLVREESHALWSLYVKDHRFKWPHGMHVPNKKVPSLAKWAIFPNSTYLLIDKRFNLIGVYSSPQRMALGVWWYTK